VLKRNRKIALAIPASIVSDIPHLREKTLKIGLIGRAAAIFRVNKIIIYPDKLSSSQKRESKIIFTLLSYMETPQYLRKRLFKIKPELKYAGILPPLRTPHHPLRKFIKDLKIGECREGAVAFVNESGALIDIGVEQYALLSNEKLPMNRRVTVKIVQLGKRPKVVLIKTKEIREYWGYTVLSSKVSLGNIFKSKDFDLIIATSRKGTLYSEINEKLMKSWKKSQKILIAFGAPTHGLYQILAKEKIKLDEVADFVINTASNQGTETIRTEEALYTSLALFNTIDPG
jgi:predicted SPOUT superfamily RNA methylase MTH1